MSVDKSEVARIVGEALVAWSRGLKLESDRRLLTTTLNQVLRAGEVIGVVKLIERDRVRCKKCNACVPESVSEHGMCGGCNIAMGLMSFDELADWGQS